MCFSVCRKNPSTPSSPTSTPRRSSPSISLRVRRRTSQCPRGYPPPSAHGQREARARAAAAVVAPRRLPQVYTPDLCVCCIRLCTILFVYEARLLISLRVRRGTSRCHRGYPLPSAHGQREVRTAAAAAVVVPRRLPHQVWCSTCTYTGLFMLQYTRCFYVPVVCT